MLHLKDKDGGYVTYGDSGKGKNIEKDDIGTRSCKIHNVLLVDGLKTNLLSISQLCNRGTRVIFESNLCSIQSVRVNKVHFVANWCRNV